MAYALPQTAMFPQFKRFRCLSARPVFDRQIPRDIYLPPKDLTMTRYEVFKACHQPDETYSSWLSTRLAEWASLSVRADELALERRSGWRFPVLISPSHHSAFDRYLQTWLAAKHEPEDQQ
jgi:hypothetical protein